jgi:hypothetical protein
MQGVGRPWSPRRSDPDRTTAWFVTYFCCRWLHSHTGDTLKEIQVQLTGNAIKSKLDKSHNYKDLFLRANTNGKFTSDDIELNEITYVDENNSEEPQFVKDVEMILSRKRKLDHNVGCYRFLWCFRLLTDEVSCTRQQKCLSVNGLLWNILIVRRRIPPSLDLTSLPTSVTSHTSQRGCGTGQYLVYLGSSRKAMQTSCFSSSSRVTLNHPVRMAKEQNSSLNGESQRICSILLS